MYTQLDSQYFGGNGTRICATFTRPVQYVKFKSSFIIYKQLTEV